MNKIPCTGSLVLIPSVGPEAEAVKAAGKTTRSKMGEGEDGRRGGVG
jgi:hypothetical protein